MTSGRDPFADDPDASRFGPEAAPRYGPDAAPPRYGPEAAPRYGPGAGPQAYGPPSPPPTYGSAPTPSYGPASAGGSWPAPPPAPGPPARPGVDPPWAPGPRATDGASPTSVERAAPVARSARRFQRLSWITLVLAVVVAPALGICVYVGLATADPAAGNAFGSTVSWLTTCGIVAAVAVLVAVLGVVAVVLSRPKLVAIVATVVAVVLPVVAVHYAVSFGMAQAARNLATDGTSLMNLLNAGLKGLGVTDGPVHTALERVGRWVGSLG